MHTLPLRTALALSGLLALLGCATATPAPTAEVAASGAAVARADGAGASTLASMEMRNARGKLELAQRALGQGEHHQARTHAEQAQADAEHALAKAEGAKARQAADALVEATRVLRLELERQAAPTSTIRN
jgi:Domain of unknown function (DUF4398)